MRYSVSGLKHHFCAVSRVSKRELFAVLFRCSVVVNPQLTIQHMYALNTSLVMAVTIAFGKVGLIASEKVVLHLVKYKCMPILLYGFRVLNLNKSQLNSLDFMANRFLMKLFNTNNIQTIEFVVINSISFSLVVR